MPHMHRPAVTPFNRPVENSPTVRAMYTHVYTHAHAHVCPCCLRTWVPWACRLPCTSNASCPGSGARPSAVFFSAQKKFRRFRQDREAERQGAEPAAGGRRKIRRPVVQREHARAPDCVCYWALSRHRRRHVHCAGMHGRAGTQNDRLSEAVVLSFGTPIPAQWTCRRRCRDRDSTGIEPHMRERQDQATCCSCEHARAPQPHRGIVMAPGPSWPPTFMAPYHHEGTVPSA